MPENVYSRLDDQITFDASGDPVPLNANPVKFAYLTVQASLDNSGTVKCGGADPGLELTAGSSQSFRNGYLNQIFVQGDENDVVNFHIEY